MILPQSIVNKASLAGNEYAWRIDDFIPILKEAADHGFACTGGQFQFRFPKATCEMYWLAADSTSRKWQELWPDYVLRCVSEVEAKFYQIQEKTDFTKAAMEWEIIREKIQREGINPIDYLYFVAYFEDESGVAY